MFSFCRWRVGKWGKCSACKFQSGVRTREVECVREAPVPGTDDVLVDDKDCTGPRPGTRELCNSHKKCSKTRRNFDNLPDEIMQHLWFQSLNDRLLEKIYVNICSVLLVLPLQPLFSIKNQVHSSFSKTAH